jgi:hypothetical protein
VLADDDGGAGLVQRGHDDTAGGVVKRVDRIAPTQEGEEALQP